VNDVAALQKAACDAHRPKGILRQACANGKDAEIREAIANASLVKLAGR
jgi:hypothetical protein